MRQTGPVSTASAFKKSHKNPRFATENDHGIPTPWRSIWNVQLHGFLCPLNAVFDQLLTLVRQAAQLPHHHGQVPQGSFVLFLESHFMTCNYSFILTAKAMTLFILILVSFLCCVHSQHYQIIVHKNSAIYYKACCQCQCVTVCICSLHNNEIYSTQLSYKTRPWHGIGIECERHRTCVLLTSIKCRKSLA